MATLAIMVGGAVLNAATFIGGNYLAQFLTGVDPKATQEEQKRHDLALESIKATTISMKRSAASF